MDALNRYAASHANMRVIDKRNEGPAVARNTALDLLFESGGGMTDRNMSPLSTQTIG